jgi:hypothetical protein
MVRFFMSLPLAFFAKTSRRYENAKVPFLQTFRARDVFGGRPVVLPLTPI